MSCFVCVERRGKTRPSRAAQLQCTEHKSEINRMFIEQLFRGAISASTSTRYRLRADTVRERERVSAGQKCCLAAFYNETRHLQDVQAITAERT